MQPCESKAQEPAWSPRTRPRAPPSDAAQCERQTGKRQVAASSHQGRCGCVRILALTSLRLPVLSFTGDGTVHVSSKKGSIRVLSQTWSLRNFSFVQAVLSLVQPSNRQCFPTSSPCGRMHSSSHRGSGLGQRLDQTLSRTRGSASRLCCLTLHASCSSPLRTRGPHLLPHGADPCRVESSRPAQLPASEPPRLPSGWKSPAQGRVSTQLRTTERGMSGT